MFLLSLRRLVNRYKQIFQHRQPRTRARVPLTKQVSYHCFFEQLESRLVPSTVTAAGASSCSSAQGTFTGLITWTYALPTDYVPGQTANVFAGGFQPGEAVPFQLSNLTNGNVYSPPWSVVDGGPDDLDGVV